MIQLCELIDKVNLFFPFMIFTKIILVHCSGPIKARFYKRLPRASIHRRKNHVTDPLLCNTKYSQPSMLICQFQALLVNFTKEQNFESHLFAIQ